MLILQPIHSCTFVSVSVSSSRLQEAPELSAKVMNCDTFNYGEEKNEKLQRNIIGYFFLSWIKIASWRFILFVMKHHDSKLDCNKANWLANVAQCHKSHPKSAPSLSSTSRKVLQNLIASRAANWNIWLMLNTEHWPIVS